MSAADSMPTRSEKSLQNIVNLFSLPPIVIVSVISNLLFKEIVRFVDFIMLSNTKGQHLWHTWIRRLLRCPDMDNRLYSREDGGSLRWVLKREIKIKNFVTWPVLSATTGMELTCACVLGEAWLVQACIDFNDDDINAPLEAGSTPLHIACQGFGKCIGT